MARCEVAPSREAVELANIPCAACFLLFVCVCGVTLRCSGFLGRYKERRLLTFVTVSHGTISCVVAFCQCPSAPRILREDEMGYGLTALRHNVALRYDRVPCMSFDVVSYYSGELQSAVDGTKGR